MIDQFSFSNDRLGQLIAENLRLNAQIAALTTALAGKNAAPRKPKSRAADAIQNEDLQ